ncbi:MAG: YcaO-like family protein [Atribacterota bacterium]
MPEKLELNNNKEIPLSETIRKFQYFFSPKYGLVNYFKEIPVSTFMPNLFYSSTRLHKVSLFSGMNMDYRVGGAALDKKQAMIAAFGEALERYSSSVIPRNKILYQTYRELKKEGLNVLSPTELDDFFTKDQFNDPEFILEPFTKDKKIGWIKGFRIISGKEIMVPASLIYMPYIHQKNEARIFHNTSTGLAFGFNKEAAILNGLCETIERDCFCITWLAKLSPPKIDFLNTSSDLINHLLETALKDFYSNITVLDIANDLGIPTFLGIMKKDECSEEIPAFCIGAATHPNKEKALYKTLIELAQDFVYAWYLKKENMEKKLDKFTGNYDRDFRNFEERVLYYSYKENYSKVKFLSDSREKKSFSDIKDMSQNSLKKSVKVILNKLKKKGFKPITVNVSSNDIKSAGGCVYRTIIPGLVNFHGSHKYRNLGNKRIYTAPKKLGYVNRVLGIEDINPHPHPFP